MAFDSFIVCGDFNFIDCDWRDYFSDECSTQAFLVLLVERDIKQFVDFSTAVSDTLDILMGEKLV